MSCNLQLVQVLAEDVGMDDAHYVNVVTGKRRPLLTLNLRPGRTILDCAIMSAGKDEALMFGWHGYGTA